MQHRITVIGDPQPVPAEDGEVLLDALLRGGVGFAYSCQAGNCGTCKCEHVSGEIFELEYSEHALSAAERARSIILACRAQVWSDVQVRRLSVEDFIVHPSRVMQCRVVELADLTHDIKRLRLAIESGGPYTFSAGQFAKLQFPFAPDTVRDYSMANTPDERELEFHIRVIANGVSGLLAHSLQLSDRVKVSGPFGSSYLREQHDGPILAIAGGSGLAPIRSIVASTLANGFAGDIHVYFGVRDERDVYGEAELRAWQARHARLHVQVVLSDPSVPATARRAGMVTEAVRRDFTDLSGFMAYLAGPPAMVDAATQVLLEKGLASRNIHADAFYSTGEQALRAGVTT